MRVGLAVFITLFLIGCDKLPFGQAKEAPQAAAKPAPAVPAQPVDEIKVNGPLLVRINGWALGLDDFNEYITALKPVAEKQNITIDKEFKAKLLKDMVQNQILAQLATERGFDKQPEFMKSIRETKTTFLASKMLNEIDKNTTVTYAEIQDFYNKNKQYLRNAEERKIREIAVATEDELNDINIKLLQKEDFGALAQKHSLLESAVNGGDLGFIPMDPGQISARKIKRSDKYWQTVLATEKGNFSPKFKGDDGKWYMIKIDDIKPGDTIALNGEIPLADGTKSKVEDQIKAGLKVKKTQDEVDRLINDFKARGKVEVKEDLLK